jgi:hypothetical protein
MKTPPTSIDLKSETSRFSVITSPDPFILLNPKEIETGDLMYLPIETKFEITTPMASANINIKIPTFFIESSTTFNKLLTIFLNVILIEKVLSNYKNIKI